ncbi:TonB-dependent receptor domain-containing protein [Sedimenticola selenatireducens]|uniref:TonB-dependent vitamin B12 receptor n=1 Tax=Sedimenticola selenatireducens TaxID=191960 RepID=A0A2N6D1K1_9GAMM|nr:TonB-dependent receptor [Sedimenticola selenatireducens]PLX63586.1 MAG: TonB-dependent vitamin B12 receptor [Sedimenticola selenatireducens]
MIRNRYYRSVILSGITLALPTCATYAATSLDRVNVTATRMAQSIDETLAAVTVITRDDIKNSQAKDITQLLDGTQGLTMSSNGGLGKVTGIRLRGTDSKQVLVLIDGMRIGSATLGTVAFQDIPLAQIERIEIVRGPRSQLYGADAMGGVIQIFTTKGKPGGLVTAEAEYGSHNTRRVALGLNATQDNLDYGFSLSDLRSDGFSSLKNNNPDEDGYKNSSFSGHLGYRFSNGLKLGVTALQAKGENEYDSAFGPADFFDTDFLQQSLSSKLEYSPNDSWDITLSFGESRDETTNFTNSSFASFFNTRRRQFSWQNDIAVDEESVLTLGIDFLRDQVEGTSSYSVNQRDNSALFAQYQTAFGANDVVIGLRHDDNEAFGDYNTGNIAWGRELTETLRLVASYGTGFRAPTFNDLYYQDPWGSNGNPNLTPEESESVELSLRGSQSWGGWNINLFRTDIEGLIDWVEIAPFTYQPQNVDRARIDGLEAGINTQLAGWRISGNLTLLDPRNRTTGRLLTDRNEQAIRIDIDREFGPTELGATLQARSHSYSNATNTFRTAGFGTLDLRVAHHLSSEWTLRGQVRNLFDRDYETIRTYNTGGRELFVSVHYEAK